MFGLDPTHTALLLFCLLLVCAFEFINGFHDTANAVATVIYTNSLKPWVAVILSGILNSAGVLLGGIAVAMGITNLLPVEVLTDSNIHHNLALILSLLITAIVWNFGTWYLGIPASSSHTLIGSILGVGLAFSFIAPDQGISYVNWKKASEIGLSLLLSPFMGFSLAVMLMYLMKQVVSNKQIFKEPTPGSKPPIWIRTILILTCSGVSFAHGSNDGQKGVGLMMLILIAIVPANFALNHDLNVQDYKKEITSINLTLDKVNTAQLSAADSLQYNKTRLLINGLNDKVANVASFSEMSSDDQFAVRKSVIQIGKASKTLMESEDLNLSSKDKKAVNDSIKELTSVTQYAPLFVFVLIALSLGLGTMIGWKRIVKTIGEKIGKQHLTYAQGASSEIVAATTIGLSTWLGLPVSTTQVLSSGIAGSMVASKGIKNLQKKTIRNIFIAWLLTLPVTILMSGGLFLLFRSIL